MQDILRRFLVAVEAAKDVIDINIAAGEARQALDELITAAKPPEERVST